MFLTLLIIGIAVLLIGLVGKLFGLAFKAMIFFIVLGLILSLASIFFR